MVLRKFFFGFAFLSAVYTPFAYGWKEGQDEQISAHTFIQANIPTGRYVNGCYTLGRRSFAVKGHISPDFPAYLMCLKTVTAYWRQDKWVIGETILLPASPIPLFPEHPLSSLKLDIYPLVQKK